MNRKSLASWALYDWASTAINAIVFTFVFSVYFARGVYGDEIEGSAAWGYAQGWAGLAIAIISPVFGAFIDRYGPRKPALKFLTIASVILCALLYFIKPSPDYVLPALVLVGLLTISMEMGQGVYGSMLPLVVKKERLGFASGLGWGVGNIGSLLCLFLVLFGVIGLGEQTGLLGITKDDSLNVRTGMLITALWFAIFAIPLFWSCPDHPKNTQDIPQSLRGGLRELKATLRGLLKFPQMILFLAGSAFYRDGLATLFAVGGLYAAGTFGMDFQEIMYFAIAINLTTGLGAVSFAFIEDRIGSKTIILLSLAGLVATGAGLVMIDDKTQFLVLACIMGMFIGPVQAAGRTLLVRLSPPAKLNEFFGLYALSGKSVSFMGPFAFALLTDAFQSQRAGIASILAFWAVGFLLICFVRDVKSARP